MRFVKRIRSKLFPVGPNLIQRFLIIAILFSATKELFLKGHHLVDLLLSHRSAQLVRLPTGELGKPSRQKQHLLLIKRNTTPITKVFLHNREVVTDLLPS